MKTKLFKKTQGNNKGFTLVETLVAVAILVIGTLGPITIAAQGIAAAGYAKDQITAYYLAQEGIEYVRNVRDGNFLEGNYWLDHLDNCLVPGGGPVSVNDPGCYIGATDAVQENGDQIVDTEKCSLTGCPLMVSSNVSSTLGYYGYSFNNYTNTTYVRTIRIFPVANMNEAGQISDPNRKMIQVDMTWISRGNARSFTLKENIYNSN